MRLCRQPSWSVVIIEGGGLEKDLERGERGSGRGEDREGEDGEGRGRRGRWGSRGNPDVEKLGAPQPLYTKIFRSPCDNRRSFRHHETRTNRSTNKRSRMTHNNAESSGFAGFQADGALGRHSGRTSVLSVAWEPIPVQRVIDNSVSAVVPRKWKHQEGFYAGL